MWEASGSVIRSIGKICDDMLAPMGIALESANTCKHFPRPWASKQSRKGSEDHLVVDLLALDDSTRCVDYLYWSRKPSGVMKYVKKPA